MRHFLLAMGLVSLYPVAATAGDVTLRKECTRDRCVYYQGSRRVFSVEKEYQTERLVVRNADRDIVAKVTEQSDGTVKVERDRWKRSDR